MGTRDQIGIAEEVTFGTPVAATRGLEVVSETLKRRNHLLQSQAVSGRGRRPVRGARREIVGHNGEGEIRYEVSPDGSGLWFHHALGDVTTSQPDDTNDPLVYEHEFTMLASAALWPRSMTIQKQVEQENGTLVPWTFAGCVVPSWTLSVDPRGFVHFVPRIHAREVLVDDASTAPLALQTLTYADGGLFTFQHGVLNLDGSPAAKVTSPQLTVDNAITVDDVFLGNDGLRAQPRGDGRPTVAGQFTSRFVDRASVYDAYADDAPLDLELTFTRATLPGATGFVEELTVTIPEVRFNDDTPTIDGTSTPQLTVPFDGLDDDVASPITVLLRNQDSTP